MHHLHLKVKVEFLEYSYSNSQLFTVIVFYSPPAPDCTRNSMSPSPYTHHDRLDRQALVSHDAVLEAGMHQRIGDAHVSAALKGFLLPCPR
jgi:hypothetical protein